MYHPSGRCAHSLQQERQEIPRRDVDIVPWVPVHGEVVHHRSGREADNVLHALQNDERRMAQRLHLIDLKR